MVMSAFRSDFVLYEDRYRTYNRTLCFKHILYLWLLASLISGVLSKQPKSKVLLKNQPKGSTYSMSKLSGLSALAPFPYFDNKNSLVEPVTTKNVTTQVGQTTYLHCIVEREGDETVGVTQVSWIRLRDFHLLTVGAYTYTSDTRFQTIYNQYSNDWALQIKYPQQADEGVYECQISTDPPASHYVNVKVLVPKAKIIGDPNFYVSVGSELNLTCVISECPEPPAFVFWYHDGRVINYDKTKGDITIQKAAEDTAVSRLHIANAQPNDSGNYTCCPSNADSASIFVHVLKGEKHAAVQNDAISASGSTRFASSITMLAIFEGMFYFWRYSNSDVSIR